MLANTEPEIKGIRTNNYPFREAVGSLMYLTGKTRPDIGQAVSYNSRRVENQTDIDVINIKRIFRYLQGTKDYGITYNNQGDVQRVRAFCDADYAGDLKTRRSTTGYIIEYNGGPISWGSRLQPVTAQSSTEAEYIAASDCTRELLYIKMLLEELTGREIDVELNIDNQSAIRLMRTGVFNRRTKHIDVRYRFLNEKVSKNKIRINYVNTNDQLADILTKPLGPIKFKKFRDVLVHKD